MKRLIIAIVLLLITSYSAHTQHSFDKTIFISICNEFIDLQQKAEYCRMLRPKIWVLYDSVGDYFTHIASELTEEEQEIVNRYDEEELISLLSIDTFPFTKEDTSFVILDTINFFSSSYSYNTGKYNFQVIHDTIGSAINAQGMLLLENAWIRDSKLCLSLTVIIFWRSTMGKTQKDFICYFGIDNKQTPYLIKSTYYLFHINH